MTATANITVNRITENRAYTNISNYHLRDKNLSLKARGLLTTILSLPPTWHLSVAGLAQICKDGVASIKSALAELTRYGYITITQNREGGQYAGVSYEVFEAPGIAPKVENPHTVDRKAANRGQSNTEEVNTDLIFDLSSDDTHPKDAKDEMTAKKASYKHKRRKPHRSTVQLDFSKMSPSDVCAYIGTVSAELEHAASEQTYTINGRQISAALIKQRMAYITEAQIRALATRMRALPTLIYNAKSYIIAALYNAANNSAEQAAQEEKRKTDQLIAARRNAEWMRKLLAEDGDCCAG